MIKTNIKMRVTPEQSKKVQEICFENGIFWNDFVEKDVLDTSGSFLYIEDTITHDVVDINNMNEVREFERYFEKCDLQEVDADLFIRTNGTCIENPNEHLDRLDDIDDETIKEVSVDINEEIKEVVSDGSKNKFYEIPNWVKDLDDLSEYLNLDPYEFNVLKTLWIHKGKRHNGTNELREINKRLHYAEKSKEKYLRKEEEKEWLTKYLKRESIKF